MHQRIKHWATTSAALLLLSAAVSGTRADTLADIYELALENDPVLKAAEASYKSLYENKALGRSQLLPQINGSWEYRDNDSDDSRLSPDFNTPDPNTGRPFTIRTTDTATDSDSKTLQLNLRQNIFNLPVWFNFKRGKEISYQAKAQFSADQQSLIIRTAEAYFNTLRAYDNFQTAKAEEKATQRQLEQTRQRFEVGLIAITDVHESQAAFDLALATRLEAEGGLGIAYEALSVLTGQDHANLWPLQEAFPIVKPEPEQRAEWVDYALENNFSLKVARFNASAAHQNAKSKKFEHLPTVSGDIRYTDSSEEGDAISNNDFVSPIVDSESDSTSFGITLDVPIFSGGAVSSSRRQAYYDFIKAREDLVNVQRNTIQATRSSHLDVVTDVLKIKARKQSITSSQSALDATQAGYEVGTRNVVDVLNSQRFLFRSKFDYANARYDYVINTLRLKEQAGQLSPQDIYELNKWLEAPQAPTAKDAE